MAVTLTIVATTTAAAQTAPTARPAPAAATGSRMYFGVAGGLGTAHQFGGLIASEIGGHVTPSVDVFGEAAWVQNAVNDGHLGTINDLGAYLQRTQAGTVTSSIDAPTWTITGGVRRLFRSSGVRPYVAGLAGVARVSLRPEFTIGGNDVTARIADYGVTLGEDLTGTSIKPAFGGGGGIMTTRGRVVIDVGARLLSVQTEGNVTNIFAIKVGMLYGF